jgi:hypothetical protein
MALATVGGYHIPMQFFAGQSSARDAYRARPSVRRVRYNAATGWYEVIGAGSPVRAYRTRSEAESHLPE